jgi:hypothetical protein
MDPLKSVKQLFIVFSVLAVAWLNTRMAALSADAGYSIAG